MPAWTVSTRPKPRSEAIIGDRMSKVMGTYGTAGRHTEAGLALCLARAGFVVVVGAVYALAQNSALATDTSPSRGSLALPKACLADTHRSDKITALIESI